ncbi:MAG TPA: hypothetical protein VGT24_08235 [Candidatus Acidoferrales bacterium]|nr:hypothetical protein [Candidatus Acidoferrales bacterium]
MRALWVDSPDDMALRTEDRAWITTEISTAIHQHINPHGWRKVREFIPLAGMFAVFVGVLALAGSGWYYAFSRVDKEARFEQSTTDSLKRIDEALHVIPIQMAASKYSVISPQELKAHGQELKKLKETLAQTPPNTPGYWPTASQIIQLLSQSAFIDFDNIVTCPPKTSPSKS